MECPKSHCLLVHALFSECTQAESQCIQRDFSFVSDSTVVYKRKVGLLLNRTKKTANEAYHEEAGTE